MDRARDGCIAGAVWAGLAAILRSRFRVLEVISTILLNFVALYLVGLFVRGPLQSRAHLSAVPDDCAPARLHVFFRRRACTRDFP
jgi:ABC-type uncharacterized transport system permease subunit